MQAAPCYLILCGVPEPGDHLDELRQLVEDCERATGVVATLTSWPATCTYGGHLAGREPLLQLMLTFNPSRTSAEQAQGAARWIVDALAARFRQRVVPAYELLGKSLVGRWSPPSADQN